MAKTKKKNLGLKKIKPKKLKPRPADLLYSVGSDAFKVIQKGLSKKKTTPYSLMSLTIKNIFKKISLEPDEFEDLLISERIFNKHDKDLKSVMIYASSIGIIENRFDECFRFSISNNPSLLEKFLTLNNVNKNRMIHIQKILTDMLSNLSVDEVDRKKFDKDEKHFVKCIIYQFTDPSSARMGVSNKDAENRFDFFKEWCSTIFSNIDPDISLKSGSKRTKKSKKKTKKKK